MHRWWELQSIDSNLIFGCWLRDYSRDMCPNFMDQYSPFYRAIPLCCNSFAFVLCSDIVYILLMCHHPSNLGFLTLLLHTSAERGVPYCLVPLWLCATAPQIDRRAVEGGCSPDFTLLLINQLPERHTLLHFAFPAVLARFSRRLVWVTWFVRTHSWIFHKHEKAANRRRCAVGFVIFISAEEWDMFVIKKGTLKLREAGTSHHLWRHFFYFSGSKLLQDPFLLSRHAMWFIETFY